MRPCAQGKSTGKVKSGKGVKGHGKGVEGFDDLGPVALPRIGKAPKGAQETCRTRLGSTHTPPKWSGVGPRR